MIFFDKTKGIRPTCFDDIHSDLNKEKQEAINLFKIKKNYLEKYKYKAYNNDEIKTALIKLFHGKCCYCESRIAGTQPGDIEHFRPKGKIIDFDSNELRPGYYWLAYDWDNLLYACRSCNSLCGQELEDEDEVKVVGKGNKFPLVKPYRNILDHKIGINNEEAFRLLINPCIEDPEKFFQYDEQYASIKPSFKSGFKSQQAQTSIDIYGLTRLQLVIDRKRVLDDVFFLIEQLNSYLDDLKTAQKNKTIDKVKLETNIDKITDKLEEKAKEGEPYAGMVRQLLKNHIKTVK
ncbi:MAG: hypothetical protein K0S53_812 [Bacteroidetes bacterium]|nr:hypothetical protein [Bacteroidota bacterium]